MGGLCGGIQESDSAGRIDQLNALRVKMQSRNFNLSRAKSEKMLENATRCMRGGFRREIHTTHMEAILGELKLRLLGRTWGIRENTRRGNTGRGP